MLIGGHIIYFFKLLYILHLRQFMCNQFTLSGDKVGITLHLSKLSDFLIKTCRTKSITEACLSHGDSDYLVVLVS